MPPNAGSEAWASPRPPDGEMPTLIGDLVEDVLRDVDSLTLGMLADHLHAEHRFAVITPEEDQRLTAVGLEQAMPAGWRPGDNPWARYLAAGLDPLTFRPLPDDVSTVASRLSTPGGRRSRRRRLAGAEEAADANAAVALASDDLDRD